MAAKKTGLSRELIIHPGETIADVLEERGITQAELAVRTGVSRAYVSSVISGKKDISAKFAFALEYALGVPKTFWMNLQVRYEAELMEYNEPSTITEKERYIRDSLNEVDEYLRRQGRLPEGEKREESILSLRKFLQVSNLENLSEVVLAGKTMTAKGQADPYILGAWVRMCQIAGENRDSVGTSFDASRIGELVFDVKQVMRKPDKDVQPGLQEAFSKYGIDFFMMQNFKGAPVQGYISQKPDRTYQMAVTIRQFNAELFWRSVFHEIGHIYNGDLGKSAKFIDDGSDVKKEQAADEFAQNYLIDKKAYERFARAGENYGLEEIAAFADSQHVLPFIVIGRLQKDRHLFEYVSKFQKQYKKKDFSYAI